MLASPELQVPDSLPSSGGLDDVSEPKIQHFDLFCNGTHQLAILDRDSNTRANESALDVSL